MNKTYCAYFFNQAFAKRINFNCTRQTCCLLFVTVFLTACKKSNDQSNAQLPGKYYIHFKLGGEVIAYDGDYNQQQANGVYASRLTFAQTLKQLTVHGSRGANNQIDIIINTDSVQTGQTYVLHGAGVGSCDILVNGKLYNTWPASVNPQYAINVKVLEHSEGWIKGTFSGTVSSPQQNGYEEMAVTEGSFTSKVTYY